VVAPADPGVPLGARGDFQRRNFALARGAATAYLGALDDDAVRAAAAATLVPGRFQELSAAPPTVLDGAHNPGGVAALTASLPAYLDGRPLTAVVSILDDKDAAAMLKELLPLFERVVFTRSQNPRSLSPATLESLSTQLDGPPCEVVPDPKRALQRAQQIAGPTGAVLATGSIYLVADLVREHAGARASTL
jgi:dihydrofolate synthase / folylpolyglutamate synthase